MSASRRPTLASRMAATRSSWSSSSSMMGSGSSDASVGSSTPLDQIKAAMNADVTDAAQQGACHVMSCQHMQHLLCTLPCPSLLVIRVE